ncbi:MAG: hypothetical protein FWE36_08315 [Erysipelotrichales bacterium]|nr:hypothetical protein [Erysipelotrichales bacterium]
MNKDQYINEEIKKTFMKDFIGAKIVKINRVCDLVCFTFELENKKKINLNIQCF